MIYNYLKEKYYVGVSGHRDLMHTKKDEYKRQVKERLAQIVKKNPDKEVIVLSPLADGADRLVVYAAKELGLRYEVVLPMPLMYYEMDFDDISFAEFMQLFYEAKSSETVALRNGMTYDNIASYGVYRDRQYRQVGLEIVDRSDEMVFLWDGIDNGKTGGTSDIYKYAKNKNKRIFVVECEGDI
jgi:hypothetical protein